MKLSKLVAILSTALVGAAPLSSHAGITGNLDTIYIGMSDQMWGWVCDSSDPYNTGNNYELQLYKGNLGAAALAYTFPITYTDGWGYERTDAAPNCNGFAFSGYTYVGWFTPMPVYLYARELATGNLTLVGHKNCSGQGWCN